MKRSIIGRVSKNIERLHHLAAEYRSLSNPATIHFTEVADELQKIVESPKNVDEGSTYNLTTIKQQLNELARRYHTHLVELEVQLVNEAVDKITVTVTYKRLFASSVAYGDKNKESLWRIDFDKVVEESGEWLKKHLKEAEEKGISFDDRPVILDKEEKEVGDD